MLKSMQRFGQIVQGKVVGPGLRAGDRVFADRLFWAKFRFRAERGTYYSALAKRIAAMPGEPISNFFAKDAARRAGEPLGKLSAHWLARFEGLDGEKQQSTVTEIFRGTVPDEDIPILAVAEQGGDIREGLETLGANLLALKEARTGMVAILTGVVFTFLILHVYLGTMAFYAGPKMEKSFQALLDPSQYGPLGSAFHIGTTFLRHWGWLLLAAEIGIVLWTARALTRYVGKHRGWMDRNLLPFDFFRRFQGAQFFAGLSAVTKRVGGDRKSLSAGLSLMRDNAYPYLAYHIERIELNLEYIPNEGGKVFDTGLFDKDTSFNIQDIAEYEEDLSKMLSKVAADMLKDTPALMLKKAAAFNRRMSVAMAFLITGLSFTPFFIAMEMKGRSQIVGMSKQHVAPSTVTPQP
ncbi:MULTISPECIES: pilus assembly protein TadE [unclassified Cupriavidus]|uniref:pilus assembly protein TadE n=1 Tax=unclassified Cupriavidus TaxID=2640874 RepID=UPI0010F512C8|nr:pilus assembly protein TadE [Cupriavidus sp. 2SB]MWL92054.1 pilus assembly protein TadE [Cupriavidus sp. SW-Y-13]